MQTNDTNGGSKKTRLAQTPSSDSTGNQMNARRDGNQVYVGRVLSDPPRAVRRDGNQVCVGRVLSDPPRAVRLALLAMLLIGFAKPTLAQSRPQPSCNPGTRAQLVTGTLQGFKHLANREALGIAAIGSAAAFGANTIDHSLTNSIPGDPALRNTFKSGAVIGCTPFALGASLAAYEIGRSFGKPCLASLGADLFRAQLMSETLTLAIKQATRRARPEGSGYSFPSGHTTVAFASATVLQQHFGWKVGIPAYAVATYVGASRVEMKRHYLSDVAFGAALGIVAGRTVTIGHQRWMITPIGTENGAAAGFTWVGKK